MIFQTPFIFPLIYPHLIWRENTHEKKIYLTFDDGPIPGTTEFVLETLHKFNAKATFFCIGANVKKHPEVFARVVAGAHSIGNHTFNHLQGWRCSLKDYIDNVALCSEQLMIACRQDSTLDKKELFRPPYGRIKRNQINALSKFRIIMWDVLTHDFSTSFSPEQCLRGSIKATREGSIVVFHDSYKAERNLKFTLPHYLEYFTAKGYSFEKL